MAETNHYVLVCGGRDFMDREAIAEVIVVLHMIYGHRLRIMHGAARGTDSIAAEVARELGIPEKGYPADWAARKPADGRNNPAGAIRNRYMAAQLVAWRARGHSVQVVAFPGGPGTRDMVEVAEKAEIDVDRMGWE